MSTTEALNAALRIGQLRAEAPSPNVAQAALEELTHVLPCDGASIVLLGEQGNSVFAEFGYQPDVSHALADVFPNTPWMNNVVGRPLPPSISTEPDDAFRKGWFFDAYLRPHGIRDGMGALLKQGDRVLGTLNISCVRDVYDDEHRRTLSVLVDALAPLVDIRGRLVQDSRLADGAPAAILHEGRAVELPGRETPAFVSEAEFLELASSFDPSMGTKLAFIWPTPSSWYRTVLEPADIPALGGTNVVVRAKSVAAPHGLSVREIEVLTCLALGLSNDAIARIFTVSARTVHGHVESVLRKTGAKTRGKAAALAWREGLVCPRPGICDPRQLQQQSVD